MLYNLNVSLINHCCTVSFKFWKTSCFAISKTLKLLYFYILLYIIIVLEVNYIIMYCMKIAVRTISISFTCKIAADCAMICHEIIIFLWICNYDTLLESQVSSLGRA